MMKKVLPILLLSCFLMNCDGSAQEEMMADTNQETCSDGIRNQDENEIDCEACTPPEIVLSEGDYRGLWNSSVVNGAVFTDLEITAIIRKGEEKDTYTGALFISNNFTSCCATTGNNGDGPITITIVDGEVTLRWTDKIPNCEGEFVATGTLVETNTMKLNLTGTDCDGDHTGTLEFFK